jgi:hypothetical protein
MREVMNGLPEVMAEQFIPRPKPSSSSHLGGLPVLLARNSGVDFNADLDMVPVPRELARALGDLIAAYVQEQGRNRSNNAAWVNGGSDPKHPAIKQWVSAQDFFLRWTHLDRNAAGDRELPTDSEIGESIRIVEDLVEVRTTEFFDNLSSLEELLAEINALTEEPE